MSRPLGQGAAASVEGRLTYASYVSPLQCASDSKRVTFGT